MAYQFVGTGLRRQGKKAPGAKLGLWTAMPALGACWALSAAPAVAQTATSLPAAAGLEEIVVTARRTQENLQDIPLAVTAFTAATIERRNLQDVRDLASSTPNLMLQTVGRGGAASAPAVFIRGIGQADNALNADPAVGIYVDGVYVPRNIGNVMSLGDVQRVEVLRGPQGTLFGKNAIGGALNLTLNQPKDTFDANVEATAGNYGRVTAKGMVNVPLAPNLFFRMSAFGNRQDGYVKLNNYPGQELGDDKSAGARARLRWLPTENLTVDLSVDGSIIESSGTPNILRAVFPTGLVPSLYNTNLSGDLSCRTAAGQASNRTCFGPVQLPTDIHRSNEVFYARDGRTDPKSENKQIGSNLTMALDLSVGTVTSISAFRNMRSESRENLGYFEALIFQGTRDPDQSKQFSQELRLNATSFDNRLKWVLGGYYSHEKLISKNDALSPLALILPYNSYPVFSLTDFGGTIKNTAFFGQATLDITSWLHLTAGIRWTDEKKDAAVTITPSAYPTLYGALTTKRTTPLAALKADVTENINAYVSYSEGFRSGGFPTRISGLVSAVPNYGPEFVTAYEAGLKSQFLDRRLRLNLAAFTTSYSNIQLAGTTFAATPPLATIINAGRAKIRGVEGELTAVVSEMLSVDGSVGYLDSKLVSLDPTANEGGIRLTTANKLPYSPKWKLAAGASVSVPMQNGAQLLFRGDVNYTSQIYFSVGNLVNAQQRAMSLVNASASYLFPDGTTEFVIGVRNLTDKVYFTSGLEDRSTNGLAYGGLAPPRTVFGTFRWKY